MLIYSLLLFAVLAPVMGSYSYLAPQTSNTPDPQLSNSRLTIERINEIIDQNRIPFITQSDIDKHLELYPESELSTKEKVVYDYCLSYLNDISDFTRVRCMKIVLIIRAMAHFPSATDNSKLEL